ncbi:MAG: carbon-nitrogen hydrolase family protein [Thaumarchaeota archaeon]|nr:carbon-nitrogen hydrolase family protein [Nitrososphaerota archaeon]
MKITVCELPDDRAAFTSEWGRLVRHAKKEATDMVLLPEIPFSSWIFAYPKFDAGVWKDAVEEHRTWMGKVPELGVEAVLGSRPIGTGRGRFNEGFAWSKGGVAPSHRKRYLPDEAGYYEARWYGRGGRRFVPFDVGGWKVGFLICSDLWSMGDARSYGRQGVGLIAVPRCTGLSTDKWLAGGRVAAVVSGAYCASSNRTGERGAARFGGLGWVVDPDGQVLATTSKERPFATVEIEQAAAEKAKKTYPRDSLLPG